MSLSKVHYCLIFSFFFCCSEIFNTEAESSTCVAEGAMSKLKENKHEVSQLQISGQFDKTDSYHVNIHLSFCFLFPPLYTNFVFCEIVILAKQNMWRDVFSGMSVSWTPYCV